jgi:hypothetical protein
MNYTRYIRRTASAVVAVCSSLIGFVLFAPSAFGLTAPNVGGGRARVPVPVIPPKNPMVVGSCNRIGVYSAGVYTPPTCPQARPTVVHAVLSGGMAGWEITLIAVGAALLAATVALFIDRARAAQRRLRVSAA